MVKELTILICVLFLKMNFSVCNDLIFTSSSGLRCYFYLVLSYKTAKLHCPLHKHRLTLGNPLLYCFAQLLQALHMFRRKIMS